MPNQYLPGVTQIPSTLLIGAASRSLPLVITVVAVGFGLVANTYQVLQNVKFVVPKAYGMQQLNGLVGTIIAISGGGSIWALNIDSSGFDAYVIPSPSTGLVIPACVVPYGSRNLQYSNTSGRQVPFQSLNNIGN